jgi:hypothetical protein
MPRLLKKLTKGALAANLATVVRVLRRGFRGLPARLSSAFDAIDPFETRLPPPPVPDAVRFLRAIPEVSLASVLTSSQLIRVDSGYSYVDGSLAWPDIHALLAILCDRSPSSVLEIGTFCGHTTRLMALNLPGSTIHTIDLPESFVGEGDDNSPLPKDDFHLIKRRRVGEAYRSDPSIGNVVQHFGDTATWDFSRVGDATCFFIDGSHTYEYARSDTGKCLALGKGRPFTILWHDCDHVHPGVTRWLAEMVAAGQPVARITGTYLAVMDSPAR